MAKRSSRSKTAHTTDANLIESKLPCIGCGSSDAFALYDDGHGFCFSEGKLYSPAQCKAAGMDVGMRGTEVRGGAAAPAKPANAELEQFMATAKATGLPNRKLTAATCKRWDLLVRRNPHKHHHEMLNVYRDKSGRIVDIKVRTPDKEFYWVVGKQDIGFFGQHLWPTGGKYLTITEGEIDAATFDQVMDKKYPVVSVPGGAAGAEKFIRAHLEWVNSFDKVVLMFDQDDAGQAAVEACAPLLAPGRAHVARLPEKDPNDCLVKGLEEDIRNAFWNAAKFKVGGVVDARTLSIKCKQKITVGRPWHWDFMTRFTFGKRPGEVLVTGSGTGMGKSDFVAQDVATTITGITEHGEVAKPQAAGLFNYEAIDYRIKLLVAGKIASRRFHLPNMPEFGFDAGWTEEERDAALAMMDGKIWDAGGRLYINEDGFNANWDDIVGRMRYLAKAEEVYEFIIDPIGAIVADMGEDDERKFLDAMMREAASLSQELGATLHFVSHLTRPSFGPSHEEGGHVRLNQFRGSNGIGMFPSFVFGLERNQQAEDDAERRKTTVRVVKDRLSGLYTGHTHSLYYDPIGGTLDTENEG